MRVPRRNQWADEACYYLMDRGHNGETVFADDESALIPALKAPDVLVKCLFELRQRLAD